MSGDEEEDYGEDLDWAIAMCVINGYSDPKIIPGDRYACLSKFGFTTAIIVGEIGANDVYLDRWCYHSPAAARAALELWNGVGEPKGWHRHPGSGRRLAEPGHQSYDDDGHLVPVGEIYVRR